MSRHILNSFLPRALALGAAMLAGASAGAAALAPQSSDANGVTIMVKPAELSASAPAWLFQVSLNTHSVELSDDLARTAKLVDAAGKQHPALAWEGAPPGGHHRNGTLRFEPIKPLPAAVELRVQRPGETAPRIFRWKLR